MMSPDPSLTVIHVREQRTPKLDAWVPLVVLPVAVYVAIPPSAPAWLLMWAIAFALYAGCKYLTWRMASRADVSINRKLAYLLGWPGLDAQRFFSDGSSGVVRPAPGEWRAAFGKTAIGLSILFGLCRMGPADRPSVVGWVGMVGIVLSLHFGLFHILSCYWRWRSIDAPPLMNRPLAARSLADFWGGRWNRAFRDLTHRFLFRPLISRLGARGATVVGFAFSGLVHEAVITLPVNAGYGLPTLYFLIQGLGLLAERSRWGHRRGIGSGWRGRVFTGAVLLLPVGMLFPPPFVLGVVVPFLHVIGAV